MAAMFDWAFLINVLVVITVILVATTFCLVCDWILHKQIVSGGAAGRYILITGCDSGFGKRAAQRFDAAGCHVIATCLMTEGANALRETCSTHLTTVQMDVTDEDSVQHAYIAVTELLQPDKGDSSPYAVVVLSTSVTGFSLILLEFFCL